MIWLWILVAFIPCCVVFLLMMLQIDKGNKAIALYLFAGFIATLFLAVALLGHVAGEQEKCKIYDLTLDPHWEEKFHGVHATVTVCGDEEVRIGGKLYRGPG